MHSACKKIQLLGKGIGSSTRYGILERLMNGPRTVNDLVRAIKLTQPAVSQHLAALKRYGLVKSKRRGQEALYSIDASYILGLLSTLTKNVEHCRRAKNN